MKMALRLFSKRKLSSFSIRALSTTQNKINESSEVETQNVKSTVDNEEIKLHTSLKDDWWNIKGTMGPLHSLNTLRVPLIRDGLIGTSPKLLSQVNTPFPLKGVKILEVGCGGGILSEPLARLGAEVTGLDASKELIDLAADHGSHLKNLQYVHDSIENFSSQHSVEYDSVVASEIVEHVTNKELFIKSCIDTLKPGGSIFITTLNRNNISWLGGIIFAEQILKLVPPGTHHWDKFITPEELTKLLDKNECRTKLIHGMIYVFINNDWFWCSNTSINYAIHAVKNTQ